jgi:hypothetical protein
VTLIIVITDAVDVFFGNVPDVVHTERVIFAAKVQLQVVVAIVIVDRYAHLKHLCKKIAGQGYKLIVCQLVVLIQILPVPRIPSCSVR